MGYWKSKVLPKIKKYFDKPGSKKAAAAEACKSFDDSKVEINKEFEEKKIEIQPKVVEIYEASSIELKSVVKGRKESDIKKNSVAIHKFLEELVKIEFPGSKQVCEASSKVGPALIPGPVFFVFEKVSTFIVTEEKETIVATEETKKEESDKAVVVGEEEKGSIEEVIIEKSETVVVEEEKASSTAEPTTELAKVEEEEPAKP